jgi:hypothetical protein
MLPVVAIVLTGGNRPVQSELAGHCPVRRWSVVSVCEGWG